MSLRPTIKNIYNQPNHRKKTQIDENTRKTTVLMLKPINQLYCKPSFHKTQPILLTDSSCWEPEEEQPVTEQPVNLFQTFRQQTAVLQSSLKSQEQSIKNQESKLLEISLTRSNFGKLKHNSYLSDYLFVKQLAKGHSSQVVKAKMKCSSQHRAIKVIKECTLMKTHSTKQAIYAHMAIPFELDHPNIAKIYQIFQWKQSYAISMQLCEGGDLLAQIKRQKKFTEATAAIMFKQIISGVYYMHKHNICHRDLKPENILYDKQSKQLKIIDFGTATRISKQKILHGIKGSTYYLAPEVIISDYNELCDVWSCGIILYIILCGFPPFQGKNDKQIRQKILYSPLEFTHSIWAKRSPQARDLITRMLTKDPKTRITAEEILGCSWFQKILRESISKNEISGQVLGNLKKFYFKNKLKAVVYSLIASQLYSNKDKEHLLKVFKLMDKDGDGVIQKHELISAFRSTQSPLTEVEVDRVLALIDTNASGKIDFTQFLVAASNEQQMLKRKQLEAAFSYLDCDHSGYLTIEEVQTFLDGSSQSEEEIRQIFSQVDENGDGRISKNEFIALLLQPLSG